MTRPDIVALGADDATTTVLTQITTAIHHATGPGDAAQAMHKSPRAVAVYAVGCWGELVTHRDMAPFHTLVGPNRRGWVVVPDMARVENAAPFDDPYWLFHQVLARWGRVVGGRPMLSGALNLAFPTARAVLHDEIHHRVARRGPAADAVLIDDPLTRPEEGSHDQ